LGFFSSIWGGSNKTLNQDIPKLGQVGDWSTGQGEGDIAVGTNFYKSLLSGDSSDQMKVLSPEINAAKTSANQDNKTATEFGTRSGGTAASTATTNDKVRSSITDLLGKLTGSAASNLTSTGGSLMGTGLSAYGQQIGASQQQMANWSKSIAGHVMISGVQSLEEAGESYLNHGQGTEAADTYSGPGT
jgi:hypothetical protein